MTLTKNGKKINFSDGVFTANSGNEVVTIGKNESVTKEDITITATAYDTKKGGQVTDTVKITVIKLKGISYKGPKMTAFKNVSLPLKNYQMIPSFKDKVFNYKVYYTPDTVNVEDAGAITWSSSFGGSSSNGDDKKEWKDVTFSQKGDHTITRTIAGNSKTYTVTMKAKVENDVEKIFLRKHKEKFFAGNNFWRTWDAIKLKIIPNRAPGIFRGIGVVKVNETLPGKWAKENFDGQVHNGKSDAARHAALSALLGYSIDHFYAAGLVSYHEASGSGIMTETVMDLLNNRFGLNEFTEKENQVNSNNDIFELIKNLVNSGKLVYLDEPHGKSDTTEKGLLKPTNKD